MRKLIGTINNHLFLAIISILILIPVIWVFVNSIKSSAEILLKPLAFPSTFEIGNYSRAWNDAGLGSGFINSTIVTLITVTLIVIISAMAAYVLSRKRFRFRVVIQNTF
ncbi:hypothetical protein ACI2OX_03970 [Bacillus sp. N9]